MGNDRGSRAQRLAEQVLSQARAQVERPPRSGIRNSPLGTIRRKWLIQQARLLAARYSLGVHLDEFVHRAGSEALTGLDLDHLEQLVDGLVAAGAAIDTACDPAGVPPAR